jgi:hypothetical protein
MKQLASFVFVFAVIATSFVNTSPCTAFLPPHPTPPPLTQLSSSNTNETPKLVNQADYIKAIDTLKQDMGIEIIPPDERPMYAIGKLIAKLPLEMVSGIRLADCDTMTLISQIQTRVVDATGIQSLDTIVSVRVGEGAYEGDTCGAKIADVARIYTEAIHYARENELGDIELEVNRLVPLRAAVEVEQSAG